MKNLFVVVLKFRIELIFKSQGMEIKLPGMKWNSNFPVCMEFKLPDTE